MTEDKKIMGDNVGNTEKAPEANESLKAEESFKYEQSNEDKANSQTENDSKPEQSTKVEGDCKIGKSGKDGQDSQIENNQKSKQGEMGERKPQRQRKPLPKQGIITYKMVQAISWTFSKLAFGRKMLRNEIKNAKGPFVIIANHEAALDFVNLIGATRTPMTFVISNSFYSTLPFKRTMDKMGVIPKQQFQTSLKDLTTMRRVIEEGRILVIYPAGLMCEDGRSTPIPAATYDFLKWLKTDVYVAKTSGTYFTMPKWSSGIRRGRTYMDIYKLFDKSELIDADTAEIKKKTDAALEFDAYHDQEVLQVKYRHGDNIEGLENVLYMCPSCHGEFSMHVKDKNILFCHKCGYAEMSDEYAFLHKISDVGKEIRYPSTWSRRIYYYLKRQITRGEVTDIQSRVSIHMLPPPAKSKFVPVGEGLFTLERGRITLDGFINGERYDLSVSTAQFASLPFSPGKYFEIQKGDEIYRLYPEDGKIVMKIVNMVKIFYELNAAQRALDQLRTKKPKKPKESTAAPKPKRPHRPRPKLIEKQRKKEERRAKREKEAAKEEATK